MSLDENLLCKSNFQYLIYNLQPQNTGYFKKFNILPLIDTDDIVFKKLHFPSSADLKNGRTCIYRIFNVP